MEPITLSIGTKLAGLGLKILKPVASWFGKRINADYWIFRRLYPLLTASKSFDGVYSTTLRSLETSGMLLDTISILASYSVRESFKKTYTRTLQPVIDAAKAEISLKPELEYLNAKLEVDLDTFLAKFIQTAQKNRTPAETIAEGKMEAGFQKVKDDLHDTFQASRDYLDLSAQIKNFSNLRDSGNHKAVLNLLQTYKQQNWHLLSVEDQRRVTVNMGVTYFEMEQYDKASEFLIDAVNYGPESADAFAYAAQGYAMIGDSINAKYYAEKSIHKDPDNVNGYSALLAAEKGTITSEKMLSVVPEPVRKKPDFALSYGARLEQNGQYQEAIELYESGLAQLKDKDLHYYELKYHLAVAKFRKLKLRDQGVFDQLESETIEELNVILGLYNECWDFYKETDLRTSKWYVLTNRAICERLLGDLAGAERSLRNSIELYPTYFTYKTLYFTLAEQNKDDESVLGDMLKAAVTDSEFAESIILKAESFIIAGRVHEAVQFLEAHAARCVGSDIKDGYYAVLIDALVKDDGLEKAAVIAHKFLQDEPESFYANFMTLNLRLYQGEPVPDDEIGVLTRLITAQSPIAYSFKLADLYIRRAQYQAAVQVLEGVVNERIFNLLAQMLLRCYHELQNHEKGVPFAEEFFQYNDTNPYLADYLSFVYETLDDWPNALRIIDQYLSKVPSDVHMNIKKAIVLFKAGRVDGGIEILDKISKEIETLSIEAQFFIAQAYLKGGQYETAMELGYRVLMLNYASANAHESYLKLTTLNNIKNRDYHFPAAVGLNCYVVLTSTAGIRRVFIVVENAKFQHEISQNEQLAKTLIGRSIGEEIDMGGDAYMIESISNKYSQAMRDCISEISMRFGDQIKSMRVVRFPETNKPEEMLKAITDEIDGAKEFETEVAELYTSVRATIGSNASLMDESPIDYWGRLTSSWEFGCYSIGDPAEFQNACSLLSSSTPVLLDIVALLTLHHIEGFALLPLLKAKTYVAQSTVDLIVDKIHAQEQIEASKSMTIAKYGDEYFKHEWTQEEKESHINSLKQLLSNVLTFCEIAPQPLSASYSEKKKIDTTLGQSFHESALISGKEKFLLYSDDRNFRMLARGQMNVDGMSTFILLQSLLSHQLITNEQYNGYVLLLVRHNYRVIPVNAEVLLATAKLTSYKLKQPFLNSTDIFEHLNDFGAVRLAVDFLYLLYASSILIDRRPIVDYMLNRMLSDRHGLTTKQLFVAYLSRKFILLHSQQEEILSRLR